MDEIRNIINRVLRIDGRNVRAMDRLANVSEKEMCAVLAAVVGYLEAKKDS